MITVNTKLIALLGNPLGQSLSAPMQNTAFEFNKLDFVYFPAETTEASLPHVVDGIRHMNFAGFGVTKPDKIRVMELLDELDPFAQKMGAVNTVIKDENGRLKGYNTDGYGFIRSFKETFSENAGKLRFLCIGAGGAARAICFALAEEGCKSFVLSSLFDHESTGLADDLKRFYGADIEVIPWGNEAELLKASLSVDVIMNATGVGMGAHIGESPVPKEIFRKEMIAFDAAYNPAETKFLEEARLCGCRTMNGLGMLLYQGVAQYEMWTGREAPVELMRETLLKCLNE